jgi:hypothetical protein
MDANESSIFEVQDVWEFGLDGADNLEIVADQEVWEHTGKVGIVMKSRSLGEVEESGVVLSLWRF